MTRAFIAVTRPIRKLDAKGTRREHKPDHARPRAGHVSSLDPFGLRDGKEGVDGSSPSEGSQKFLLISPF